MNSPSSASTPTSIQPTPVKRRRAMLVLFIVFATLGVAWGVWWYTVLRFEQATDDAYVTGNLVQITSQVPGTVKAIAVDDTQNVVQNELLVTLDPTDAQLAFENAQHKLADTVRATRKLMADVSQLDAAISIRRIALEQMQDNLSRRQILGNKNAVGKEELSHARNNFVTAQHALRQALEQRNATAALLLDTALAQQPGVLLAASAVRERWLALERTRIVSPVSGQVVKRNVQAGSQVTPGKPLMTIVPLNDVWIDANFKEVQLADLRAGQPVTITVDMYGQAIRYSGTLVGFAAGTGSVFSLLPPQNATGNWIKIVQRVPVRIQLNPAELAAHPLLVGLSCTVTVDITHKDGPPLGTAPTTTPSGSLSTTVYNVDFAPANQLIQHIINANSMETDMAFATPLMDADTRTSGINFSRVVTKATP